VQGMIHWRDGVCAVVEPQPAVEIGLSNRVCPCKRCALLTCVFRRRRKSVWLLSGAAALAADALWHAVQCVQRCAGGCRQARLCLCADKERVDDDVLEPSRALVELAEPHCVAFHHHLSAAGHQSRRLISWVAVTWCSLAAAMQWLLCPGACQ
jgi:hypothetical protein